MRPNKTQGYVYYLNHGKNVNTLILVALCNSLGSQETSLFSRIPVKFNRSLRTETSVHKSTEDLQDGNSARTIIVSTGRATPLGQPHVDGILVRADNDGLVREGFVLTLEACC